MLCGHVQQIMLPIPVVVCSEMRCNHPLQSTKKKENQAHCSLGFYKNISKNNLSKRLDLTIVRGIATRQ